MADSGAVFTYTDERGVRHTVGSIKEVPQRYLRSMEAVGVEDPEAGETDAQAEAGALALDAGGTRQTRGKGELETVSPALVLAAVFLVLWFKIKNFVARCMLIALFAMGFAWFTLGWVEDQSREQTKGKPKGFAARQWEKATRPTKWKDMFRDRKDPSRAGARGSD